MAKLKKQLSCKCYLIFVTLLDGKSQGALHTHFAPINLFDCSEKTGFLLSRIFFGKFLKIGYKTLLLW